MIVLLFFAYACYAAARHITVENATVTLDAKGIANDYEYAKRKVVACWRWSRYAWDDYWNERFTGRDHDL